MARWTRAKDRQPTDDDYPIVCEHSETSSPPEVWVRPAYLSEHRLWISARDVDWDAGLPSEIEEPARGIEIDGAPGYRYWVEDDQVVGENDRGGRIYQPVWATVQSAKIAAGLGLLNADESPDPEPAKCYRAKCVLLDGHSGAHKVDPKPAAPVLSAMEADALRRAIASSLTRGKSDVAAHLSGLLSRLGGHR